MPFLHRIGSEAIQPDKARLCSQRNLSATRGRSAHPLLWDGRMIRRCNTSLRKEFGNRTPVCLRNRGSSAKVHFPAGFASRLAGSIQKHRSPTTNRREPEPAGVRSIPSRCDSDGFFAMNRRENPTSGWIVPEFGYCPKNVLPQLPEAPRHSRRGRSVLPPQRG